MSDKSPRAAHRRASTTARPTEDDGLIQACMDAAAAAGIERPDKLTWVVNPLARRQASAAFGEYC